jgi:RNA polymerase sigma-70 factor (ECF subfamily)
LQAGEPEGRDGLLQHARARLEQLASRMLRDFPGVRRWEQTDDVLQGALVRLLRCLEQVQPATPRDFLALAALQIRRELIDLARHYHGPHGPGAHHATGSHPEPDGDTHDPARLAEWSEMHALVEQLPQPQQEVFGLLHYQGLSQAEAAAVLGVVVRTVQRHWQAALLSLHDRLGRLPET